MKYADFKDAGIINFTPKEVIATGADLADVQLTTMSKLQAVRMNINRRVYLIFNGLTTGNHDAKEHPKGLAVDFALDNRDGPIDVKYMVYEMLKAGFTGIGVYFNDQTQNYSFHADSRTSLAMWCGYKLKRDYRWTMCSLIVDPSLKIKELL